MLESESQKNFRWNAVVNGLDMVFFALGSSLVSRETVLPALVSTLTDSKLAIGLIPALYSVSYYLPQLLMANHAEQLRYKKPFVMFIGGLGERFPYLLIGLTLWLLAGSAPQLALVLLFLFLGVGAAASGMATPAWYDMIAKVIPVQRRGIWSGISNSLGALLAIGGALVVGNILERVAYPTNFAWIFFLAFVAWNISFFGLSLNREPPSENLKQPIPLRRYLAQLPSILRGDRNFRRYLLSRSVVHLGTMAVGFFTVYGQERFAVGGVQIGIFTALLVASQACMNLVWGMFADRLGHKIVLTVAPVLMLAAVLTAWLAPTIEWLMVTFVLLGIYLAADNVSAFNIIVEFAPEQYRPTYIGLTNTLLAPALTLSPLIGGWLATILGYGGLFAAALLAAAVGGLLMYYWVDEPRRMRPVAPLGVQTLSE